MNSKLFLAIVSVLMVLAAAGGAVCESLWDTASDKSLFADKRACRVGDIVTVIIVESAVSSQQASTDAKKSSEVEAGPGTGPLLGKIPLFQYGGGDSMKASGSTTRTTRFVANMTAKVVKVNDNGTLEIEGTKFVQTNNDKEEIKLTGAIRKEDIGSDNTVLSTYIADAKITHTGSGPVNSRQKEGLISRLFRILF